MTDIIWLYDMWPVDIKTKLNHPLDFIEEMTIQTCSDQFLCPIWYTFMINLKGIWGTEFM